MKVFVGALLTTLSAMFFGGHALFGAISKADPNLIDQAGYERLYGWIPTAEVFNEYFLGGIERVVAALNVPGAETYALVSAWMCFFLASNLRAVIWDWSPIAGIPAKLVIGFFVVTLGSLFLPWGFFMGWQFVKKIDIEPKLRRAAWADTFSSFAGFMLLLGIASSAGS